MAENPANADKARIEDQTQAPVGDIVRIEQLATPRDLQATDIRQNPERSRPPITQISPTGERKATEQVERNPLRTASSLPALSSRKDGRPEAVAVLGGADRCDPQSQAAQDTALCRRIIETRAAEFPAQRPALISPEAALLAPAPVTRTLADAQRMDRKLGSPVQGVNPDDQLDQELAAIALTPQTPTPVQEPDPAAKDSALNQLLSALALQIQSGE